MHTYKHKLVVIIIFQIARQVIDISMKRSHRPKIRLNKHPPRLLNLIQVNRRRRRHYRRGNGGIKRTPREVQPEMPLAPETGSITPFRKLEMIFFTSREKLPGENLKERRNHENVRLAELQQF